MFFFKRKKSGKRKVLIVEDELPIRLLLRDCLSYEDFEIHETADGSEGVKLAAKLLPDLIIMDVMLPTMSGLDATRAIRANPKTKNIPILACTVKNEMGDVETLLTSGITDYISKPFEIERFRIKAKRILDKTKNPA